MDANRLPPAQEKRAEAVMRELRCLVCQNESIADSDADLARDLRGIVRQRIAAGDSEDEARDYIVARYGDWVLLDPPFKPSTALLWISPALILIAGGLAIVLQQRGGQRRRAELEQAPLDGADRRKLDQAMAEDL